MTTAKSKNPAYPDADPTAPGGMSRAALIKELVAKHGYEDDKDVWAQVKWPVLIDMVCQERLDREREATPAGRMDAAVAAQAVAYEEQCTYCGRTYPAPVALHHSDEECSESKTAEDMFDLLDEAELIEDAGDVLADFEAEFEVDAVGFVPEGTLLPEDECEHPACDIHGNEGDLLPEDDVDQIVSALEAADMAEQIEIAEDGVLDPEQMFAEMADAREAATPPPLFIGLPVVKDYIFDGHAGAGPSGAERWMNCTMSLTAARRFLETLSPNQQATFAHGGAGKSAARQGTTAHAVGEAEANLVLGRATQDEVDLTLLELSITPEDEGEAYDDEMAEYVAEYVDLVKSYAQERGNEAILIESRVEADIPLTDLHEGEVYVIRGSADFSALPIQTGTPESRTLVVGDLKYGEGMDVDVDENPQIRLYALGVLMLLADPETGQIPLWVTDVVYHIIQPRLGGIKTWTESIDDLLAWRDEVLAPELTKALYGENEGATFAPSDLACQWCPARGTCPALIEQRVDAASGLFDEIAEIEFLDGVGAVPNPVSLTDTRLGELLTMAAGLHDIYKDLKEEAQRRLHRGDAVPGYQLVNYTPPRKWKEGAERVLAKKPELWTDPKLLTPTQAEKILGPEVYPKIEKLVIKPDKRPVIAKEGDRRKTWEGKPPEAMFPDDVTDEEAS